MNSPNNNPKDQAESAMRDEYDFSGGVRGKYASRYAKGTNIVLLDRDVAEVFSTPEAVNTALRALAGIIHHHEQKAS